MPWLSARVLVGVLTLGSLPTTAVHYRVTRVDPVEREFRSASQSKPVIGTMSTIYKINGQRVGIREFWEALRPGDEVDAKVKVWRYFSQAVVVSINLKRRVTP